MMPPIQIAISAAASSVVGEASLRTRPRRRREASDADRVAADDAEPVLTGEVPTEKQALQREADDHRRPATRSTACEPSDASRAMNARSATRRAVTVSSVESEPVDGGGQAARGRVRVRVPALTVARAEVERAVGCDAGRCLEHDGGLERVGRHAPELPPHDRERVLGPHVAHAAASALMQSSASSDR